MANIKSSAKRDEKSKQLRAKNRRQTGPSDGQDTAEAALMWILKFPFLPWADTSNHKKIKTV